MQKTEKKHIINIYNNIGKIIFVIGILVFIPGIILFVKNIIIEKDNFLVIQQKSETLNYFSLSLSTVGTLFLGYIGFRQTIINERSNIRPNILINKCQINKENVITLNISNNSNNYAYDVKLNNTVLYGSMEGNKNRTINLSYKKQIGCIKINRSKYLVYDDDSKSIKKIVLNYKDSANNIIENVFTKKNKNEYISEIRYK